MTHQRSTVSVCVCVQLTHKLFLMFKFCGRGSMKYVHALWVELLYWNNLPPPQSFKLMTPKSDFLMKTCSSFCSLLVPARIVNYLRLYTDPASPAFSSLSTMAWRLFLQPHYSKCFPPVYHHQHLYLLGNLMERNWQVSVSTPDSKRTIDES